ncbi:hypothetical protein [Pseudomonas sp. PS02303]|uniref:hypothetical protein n=1 Tax=Pseudomonas sp. PS02303 TaxID=2991429 RepID=UPI00249C81EA|nr:hypothetical protein [Pseudomonas sp. PS02303]
MNITEIISTTVPPEITVEPHPQLTPGRAFYSHVANSNGQDTRFIYSALPILTLVCMGQRIEGDSTVHIDPNQNYVIYADGLRIRGELRFKPGGNVKIVARTLYAEAAGGAGVAAIDVSGEDALPNPVTQVPQTGLDGHEGTPAIQYTYSTTEPGEGGDAVDGGCGLPGKDGTDAGQIELFINRMEAGHHIELRARGGNGAEGQVGGNGTKGGDGGLGCWYPDTWRSWPNLYETSKPGKPGGAAGYGGRGGRGGNGGVIKVQCLQDGISADQIIKNVAAGITPLNAKDGIPGEGGMQRAVEGYMAPGHDVCNKDGNCYYVQPRFYPLVGDTEGRFQAKKAASGGVHPRPANELDGVRVPGVAGTSPETVVMGFKDFARVVNPSQIMMLCQRMKAMYLTATISSGKVFSATDPSVPTWYVLLDWLNNVLASIDEKASEIKTSLAGNALILVKKDVARLKNYADRGKDIFGKDAYQIDTNMLTFTTSSSFLKTKLDDLNMLQSKHDILFAALEKNDSIDAKLQTAMFQATAQQGALKLEIQRLIAELIGTLTAQLINITKEIQDARGKIETDMAGFTADLMGASFDADSFFSALTMIAFSPPAMKKDGGLNPVSLGMTGIQTAQLLYTSFTQIKGDDGSTIGKDYLVQKVKALDGELFQKDFVATFQDAKGALQDNIDSVKILTTLREYQELVSNYSSNIHSAKLKTDLHALAGKIMQRNNFVMAYNAQVATIFDYQQQIVDIKDSDGKTLGELAEKDDPGRAMAVAFLSKQYDDALSQGIREVYLCNKAYMYWSLDTRFNVFEAVLNHSTPWDQPDMTLAITPDTLNACQTQLRSQFENKLRTMGKPQQTNLGSKGTVLRITDEESLRYFKEDKSIRVTIDKAFLKGGEKVPYTLYDEINDNVLNARLYELRVFLRGAVVEPSEVNKAIKLVIEHDLYDKFYMDNSDTFISFAHESAQHQNFEYYPDKEAADFPSSTYIKTAINFGGNISQDSLQAGGQDAIYAGVGPYADWTISLHPTPKVNLDGLKCIEIQLYLVTYA